MGLVVVLAVLWLGWQFVRSDASQRAADVARSHSAAAPSAAPGNFHNVDEVSEDQSDLARAAIQASPLAPRASERWVSLRVLDGAGAPLVEATCEVEVSSESEQRAIRSDRAELRTDSDGRLRVRVDVHWDPSLRRTLRVMHRDAGRPSTIVPLTADLSAALPTGVTELGDLTLGTGELVGAGVVLDSDGAPRRGARVFAWFAEDPTHEPLEATTAANGRFTLREASYAPLARSGRRLVLRAGAHRHAWSDPIDAEFGETELAVRLVGGGAIRGHVSAEDPWSASRLTLVACRTDVELPDGASDTAEVETELEPPPFRLLRLAPGVYRVEARSPEGEVLASVAGLVVRDGELTTDPRLEPLVVGPIPEARLRFVDRRGRGVTSLELTRRLASESGGGRWLSFGPIGSKIRLRAAPGDGPLLARARGKVPKRVDVVSGEHDVQLDDAPIVRWTFSRAATGEERDRRVRLVATTRPFVDVAWTSVHELELGSAVGSLGGVEDFGNSVRLPPGVHELAWLCAGGEGELLRYVDPLRPRITVAAGPDDVEVTIDVPDDLLARLERGERHVPATHPDPEVDPWRLRREFPPRARRPGPR